MIPAKDIARFESHFTPEPNSGCWLWHGARMVSGHGYSWYSGSNILAHRFSYEIYNGSVGELYACHRCDIPECVNPDHLFLGTQAENMKDMRSKKRGCNPPRRLGENHPIAKLNEEKVLEIRKKYSEGETLTRLGKGYGVTPQAIYLIVNRKKWKHI